MNTHTNAQTKRMRQICKVCRTLYNDSKPILMKWNEAIRNQIAIIKHFRWFTMAFRSIYIFFSHSMKSICFAMSSIQNVKVFSFKCHRIIFSVDYFTRSWNFDEKNAEIKGKVHNKMDPEVGDTIQKYL